MGDEVYPCPVCETCLGFQPWDGETGSQEICTGCGIHFGYNDAEKSFRKQIYLEWRRAWLAHDSEPFVGDEWRQVSAEVIRIATSSSEAEQ